MGFSDGAADYGSDHSEDELTYTGQDAEPSKSDVYVSVFDPIGDPAFKPSKTKPLPKWMSRLPSSIQPEQERQQKTSSSSRMSNSHEMSLLEERLNSKLSNDNLPSRNQLHECSSEVTTPRSQRTPPATPSTPVNINRTARGSTTLAFDPNLIRKDTFGSVDGRAHRKSQAIELVSDTSPEYTFKHLPSGQRSPCPGSTEPPVNRKNISYFPPSLQKRSRTEPFGDSCYAMVTKTKSSPPERPDSSTVRAAGKRPPPFTTNSSEYIQLYQPKTSETNLQRYIAKEPEPILDKFKRQKVSRKRSGEAADDTVEKRRKGNKSVKLARDEEYRLDPRREDLKKELRNLFCEE